MLSVIAQCDFLEPSYFIAANKHGGGLLAANVKREAISSDSAMDIFENIIHSFGSLDGCAIDSREWSGKHRAEGTAKDAKWSVG